MEIDFISHEFEHLKTAYFDDFFFQNVEIINTKDDEKLLVSEFQGKFLQLIWDALIEFESQSTIKKRIKQFGKLNNYIFEKNDEVLSVYLEQQQAKHYSYKEFYRAFYNATKRYLNFIKKENPRIVLDVHFQQLSASCYYFERHQESQL